MRTATTRRAERRRHRWTGLTAIALLFTFSTGWTGCHLFSSERPYQIRLANDSRHSVFIDPALSRTAQLSIIAAVIDYDRDTNLRMSVTGNPFLADVIFQLDTNLRAWAETGCTNGGFGAHPERRCNQFRIGVNPDRIGNGARNWRHVGCHEIGHTLGLHHREEFPKLGGTRPPSCMVSGRLAVNERLDIYDILTLNEAYPAP